MQILLNSVDVTDSLIGLELTRTNELSQGSVLSGNLSLSLPINEPVPQRCGTVVVVLNPTFPDSSIEYQTSRNQFSIKTSKRNSEGVTELAIAQVNGMGLSKAPVIGEEQRKVDSLSKAKRPGEISASMLRDFGISNAIPPFGIPQTEAQGSNESDPFSQVSAICYEHGLLTYISKSGVCCVTSLNTVLQKSPSANSFHVLENTGIETPELDELFITGVEKTIKQISNKGTKEVENIRDDSGGVTETIITEIDENGLETRKVYTVMRLLRPDTHPNSNVMVYNELSKESRKVDNEKRILWTKKEVERNTAAISPESTDDSILIPAETVTTYYNFDEKTNDIKSIKVETYKVFVIGRREAFTYVKGVLEKKKIPQLRIPSTTNESPLTSEQKRSTVISPLVLARVETTSYKKLGANKWRETIEVKSRELESETESGQSDEEKGTVVRIQKLSGLTTVSHKSKIVYSVPSVQIADESENVEIQERILTHKITKPGLCSSLLTRKEMISFSSSLSPSDFAKACSLAKISSLSDILNASIRYTYSSSRLLTQPFSLLQYEGKLWLVKSISMRISPGEPADFAGQFVFIKDTTTPEPLPGLDPPKVTETVDGELIETPILNQLLPVTESVGVSDSVLPATTSYAPPISPPVSGSAVTNQTVNTGLTTNDNSHTLTTQPGRISTIQIPTADVASSPLSEPLLSVSVGNNPPLITGLNSIGTNNITIPETDLTEDVVESLVFITPTLFYTSSNLDVVETVELNYTSNLFPNSLTLQVSDTIMIVNRHLLPVN
jgi:hypothetical protein